MGLTGCSGAGYCAICVKVPKAKSEEGMPAWPTNLDQLQATYAKHISNTPMGSDICLIPIMIFMLVHWVPIVISNRMLCCKYRWEWHLHFHWSCNWRSIRRRSGLIGTGYRTICFGAPKGE